MIQPKHGIGWRGARERKADGLCWRGTEGYKEEAKHKDNYVDA